MSGLIACEAITEIVEAQNNSKNRPRGTLEEKPLKVSAEVYRQFMKDKAIPKIRTRLNWKKREKIIVRHDGAKSHNGKGNNDFFTSWGQKYGWNLVFDTQCPQSPDVNILDISVFSGMQAKSEEYRMDSSSVSDLVKRVRTTFFNYPPVKLEHCWAVLHEHYHLIRMFDGGNKYPDPHCGIHHRVAAGKDPVNYSIHFDEGYDTEDEEDA
jgi:hypothetical protein